MREARYPEATTVPLESVWVALKEREQPIGDLEIFDLGNGDGVSPTVDVSAWREGGSPDL